MVIENKEASADLVDCSGLVNSSSICIQFHHHGNSLDSLDKERILNPKFNDKRNYGTNDSEDSSNPETPTVSSIIGSFGWFQMMVLVFSGLREGLVGYDALITSILLQPESGYICDDNLTVPEVADSRTEYQFVGSRRHAFVMPNHLNDTGECYIRQSSSGNDSIPCQSWLFPNSDPNKASLVVTWSLVCSRSWLIALIESVFFMGLMVGNLLWGYLADKLGRKKCYLISHALALVAGWLAVFMPTIELFAITRFFTALGSIGYNIIYTIQIELLGTKHRSYGTMFNHLGWGLGAISIPLMASLSSNTHVLLSVAPILSLIMFPLAFWLPESSRWLMANGEFSRAKKELIRAAKFNGKSVNTTVEKTISLLNDKIISDKLRHEQLRAPVIHHGRQTSIGKPGGEEREAISSLSSPSFSAYRTLFSNPTLVKDTIIIAYVSFSGHLFYYLQTINFGYMENLSIEANFISSGAGEWFSLVVGAIMLRFFNRKTCMSLFLLFMTLSFTFQSLIDSNYVPSINTPIIVTLNNTIGTLSSLLLVFVVLIVNQEVYPTVIRQTGSSIGNTLGESGSTLAPWLIQLNRSFGLWRSDLVCAFMCLIGIFSAFFVTKTDDIELVDVQ